MADQVTLTLAHPLTADQAERLRAKDTKDYNIGDKITVPLDEGHAIINAGYAQGIEPEDTEAVQGALAPSGSKSGDSKSAGK